MYARKNNRVDVIVLIQGDFDLCKVGIQSVITDDESDSLSANQVWPKLKLSEWWVGLIQIWNQFNCCSNCSPLIMNVNCKKNKKTTTNFHIHSLEWTNVKPTFQHKVKGPWNSSYDDLSLRRSLTLVQVNKASLIHIYTTQIPRLVKRSSNVNVPFIELTSSWTFNAKSTIYFECAFHHVQVIRSDTCEYKNKPRQRAVNQWQKRSLKFYWMST